MNRKGSDASHLADPSILKKFGLESSKASALSTVADEDSNRESNKALSTESVCEAVTSEHSPLSQTQRNTNAFPSPPQNGRLKRGTSVPTASRKNMNLNVPSTHSLSDQLLPATIGSKTQRNSNAFPPPLQNAQLKRGGNVPIASYKSMNLKDPGAYRIADQSLPATIISRMFITESLTQLAAKIAEGLSKELDADYGVEKKTEAHNMAQDVVDNELQWAKIKQAMKEKGAVTGLSLKQHLNSLLEERIVEIEQEKGTGPTESKKDLRNYLRSQSLRDISPTSIRPVIIIAPLKSEVPPTKQWKEF